MVGEALLGYGARSGSATVTMDVSVIIPCFNCAATIPEQLAALERQTFAGEWEIVAVDNGSTDDTVALLRRWQRRLRRLRVVELAGTGPPARSRNAGVRAARGELLVFTDADDMVADCWVQALVEALGDHDVVGGPLRLDALNRTWPAAIRERPADPELPLGWDYLPFADTANLGVRRLLALDIGGFDETLTSGEDRDFSWRAIHAGASVGFAPGALVQKRLRENLRGRWRQQALWAFASVELYLRHRERGMPARRTARAFLAELWMLCALTAKAAVSPRARVYWIDVAARLVGRARASWRYRTVYL